MDNLSGCYHCVTIFETANISEWIDNGKTPLCPSCDIDAVTDCVDLKVLKLFQDNQFNITKERPAVDLGIQYDKEAKVFIAGSNIGIATEADTLDLLINKLGVMIPEILKENSI